MPFQGKGTENPYAVHADLQECMQSLVGIIRTEGGQKALEEIGVFTQRLGRVTVEGGRAFNPAWHLTLDLLAMLAVSRPTLAALERKEERGGHTGTTIRRPIPRGQGQRGRAPEERRDECVPGADPRDARRPQEALRGEEIMAASEVTMRVWRGDAKGGAFKEYRVQSQEGMVVLDVIHAIQGTQAGDLAVRWNCKAGKCGSCSAEINGKPRLMCMTRMNTFTPGETISVAPMKTFPLIRDLATDATFNYEKAKTIPAFTRPQELTARGACSRRKSSAARSSASYRVPLCQDARQ